MIKKRLVRVVPILLALSGVGLAQSVKYNFEPSFDFAKLKTYKWAETNSDAHPDELMDRQIKAAIDSELGRKGLVRSGDGTTDGVVAYHIRVDQEKQIDAYAMPGWRMGGGMGTMSTSTINIGTLVLDVYDLASRQLVWKGYAQKTLNPSKDPEKNRGNLQKAIAKLLKDYPPKKK